MFHGDVDPSRRTLFCVVDRASNKHTMLLIASELEFDLRPLLASLTKGTAQSVWIKAARCLPDFQLPGNKVRGSVPHNSTQRAGFQHIFQPKCQMPSTVSVITEQEPFTVD